MSKEKYLKRQIEKEVFSKRVWRTLFLITWIGIIAANIGGKL